jgi:hypothetical protein
MVDVLGRWLTVKDLSALDAAECNRLTRGLYHDILKSESLVIGNSLTRYKITPSFMQWIADRMIKLARAIINRQSLSDPIDPSLIASFLKATGKTLLDLAIFDSRVDILAPVCCIAIVACTQLNILELWRCKHSSTSTTRRLIAHLAPTLERLVLGDSEGVSSLPENRAMDKLQYLSIMRVKQNDANICAFTARCRNLLYFHNDNMSNKDDCLYVLAQSCPSLMSLHYGNAAPGSIAGLEAVLLACKELRTIHFTGHSGFTNTHVASIVKHCKKLRALRLEMCVNGINEECMAILAPRLAEIRNLALVRCHFTTDAPLHMIAQHCRELRSLSLVNLMALGLRPITEGTLVTLLSSLPFLEELDLSYAVDVSDTVLGTVARKCPSLHTLALLHTQGFREDGILALAAGCRNLEKLYISGEDKRFSELSLKMWRLLRPNLKMESFGSYQKRWIDIRADVYW